MFKKEINLNKKIIVILLLINFLIIGLSYSYALFQTTIVKNNIVKIQSGDTTIKTNLNGYSDNIITFASGESKTINVTLTNPNVDYNILYKMYYTIENGSGTIIATNTTDSPSGEMKGEKTLAITLQNNNTTEITIKVATKGALINSSITLTTGEYEIIVDTDPPVITAINDAGEGKITFTVTDTGSGVDKYCVNQNQTDTTSCTWLDAVSGSQTTDVVATTSGTYYIHVKDLAGNIGHSSKVSLSLNTPAGSLAEEKYGTGGLIAINTSGTLYDGTGTIREYRYSGATANNYIKFNNGEMWRIVGMFKNSSGDWNLKLMRNTMLTSAELPSTYTYSGTSYTIENGTTGYVYWNYSGTTDNNDWTTAGLQYYLNGTDGYFGTLSSGAQALVDTSYTYYLGNYGWNVDTAISSYTSERGSTVCSSSVTSNTHNNNCNIWYGNKATWSKSTNSNANGIALLYPSDYGYSASSSYWGSPTLVDWSSTQGNTSWMYATANHTTYEWMLSPSSDGSYYAARWDSSGFVGYYYVYNGYGGGARPVLNLLSTAEIDTNHTGSSSDPYVLIE